MSTSPVNSSKQASTPKSTSRSQRPPTTSSPKKQSRAPDPEIVQISQDLINGTSSSLIDSSKSNAIFAYLKQCKQEALKKPDYYLAQRIDDVCAEVMLVSNQTSYCGFRGTEIEAVKEKLEQAKRELQKILDERQNAQNIFDGQKQRSIEKLQKQHEKELEAHDNKYNGELPPKFKKLSAEVLNIRQQETFLRSSKRYIEAQQMKEEADALESFELARQEIRFHNEGVEVREKILLQQQTQMSCLLEKMNRQYQAMMPNAYEQENHWKTVIGHLEAQIKKLRGDSNEVKRVTNSMLTKERGLPSLGTKVPQSPMTRVTTVNNQRAYTRYGSRRSKSSAHS